MKRILYLFIFLFTCQFVSAQAIYETIRSEKLNATRKLKIQLPRDYEKNVDKKYPIVVVLDGDYLFELVAGNVDYYSYWEDLPEVIVVGINEIDDRDKDVMYSENNSLPIDSGASFYEFIGSELLPYIREKYRAENFNLAIGHGATANFINYFLLKNFPIFQGYIVLSPKLAPSLPDYLKDRLSKIDSKTFYYLATATGDIDDIYEETKKLNTKIKDVNNSYLEYDFDEFEGLTHYSMAAQAIPKALERIFKVYQPITPVEYKRDILTSEKPAIKYLKNKYQSIHDLFGIDKTILINDFKAISAAIEKKSEFNDYKELSVMARNAYPSTLLGHFYLARYYEESNAPKKAMNTYQSSFIFDEIGGLTKEDMIERANKIKEDFDF